MLREFNQIFNGAFIRAIAGIRDVGEVIFAIVGNPNGGSLYNKESDDVWVHSQDPTPAAPSGMDTSRLFFPLNALFRLPKKGDAGIVLRPRRLAGPGHGLLLHGDGGGPDNAQVPDWLDENTCGVAVDENTFKIESGQTIHANGDDYSAFNTEDFDTDLDSFLATVGGITPLPTTLPQCAAALATIIGAANDFATAKAANSAYKSGKLKHGR